MSAVENNYIYVELNISEGNHDATVQAEKMLNDIYMDLFLNRIHRKQIRKRILTLIDKSLDHNNKSAFLKYCEQLKKFEDVK